MANLGRFVLILLLQVFVAKIVLPIGLVQFSDSKSSFLMLEQTEDSEQNKDLESDNTPEFIDDFFESNSINYSAQYDGCSGINQAIPYAQQHHFIEYYHQSLKPPCHN